MMNQAFKNLKSYNALKSNEIRQIIAFSDQFTTCSLDINKVKEKIHRPLCDVAESENNDDYKNFIAQKVIDIVQIVNKHHHTKACRKHLTKCRFHYPKFPSTKTILAVPVSKIYDYVDADDEGPEINEKDNKPGEFYDPYFDKIKTDLKDLNEEERTKKIDKYRQILTDVKEVLDNDELIAEIEAIEDLKESVETLCEVAEVSMEDYENALKISFGGGHSIVLQRHVRERFINNYNPEWIYCWNGNMDLQVCLDYHSVITYISNYYSKSDTVTIDHMKEAARQFGKESFKQKMSKIMNVYLTHRQMGHPEATYRLISSLHLKESNLGSKFAPTGFPINRSKYLQAVHEDNEYLSSGRQLITIEGKEGEFVEKPTLISKYERRPRFNPTDSENLTKTDLENLALKYMTYSQFIKEYDPISKLTGKKKKKPKKSVDNETESGDDDNISEKESSSDEDIESEMVDTECIELPCDIELEESDLDNDVSSSSEDCDSNKNGTNDVNTDGMRNHGDANDPKELFICNYEDCSKSFTRKWHLENHMMVDHFYCNICDEIIEDHFHCDICGEILDFSEDLRSARSNLYKHKKEHKIVLPKRKYAPGKSLTLPKFFKLEPSYPGEPKYMRLRSYPAAMRRHKIKQKNHEYFYSEILLYSPFYKEDCEIDGLKKFLDDEEECRQFYIKRSTDEGKSDIEIARSKIMPHLESVTEGRLRAEESKESHEDVGAQLDPAKEQETVDCEEEGIIEDPDHLILEPGELLGSEDIGSNTEKTYRRIELGNIDELSQRTRHLDEEQRYVVDLGIKYGKEIVKSVSGNGPVPEPPLLVVQGNLVELCNLELQRVPMFLTVLLLLLLLLLSFFKLN